MLDGAEQIIFQEKFGNWSQLPISVAPPERPKRRMSISEPFNIESIFKSKRPEDRIFDDGTGTIVEIFRIKEFEKESTTKGTQLLDVT